MASSNVHEGHPRLPSLKEMIQGNNEVERTGFTPYEKKSKHFQAVESGLSSEMLKEMFKFTGECKPYVPAESQKNSYSPQNHQNHQNQNLQHHLHLHHQHSTPSSPQYFTPTITHQQFSSHGFGYIQPHPNSPNHNLNLNLSLQSNQSPNHKTSESTTFYPTYQLTSTPNPQFNIDPSFNIHSDPTFDIKYHLPSSSCGSDSCQIHSGFTSASKPPKCEKKTIQHPPHRISIYFFSLIFFLIILIFNF